MLDIDSSEFSKYQKSQDTLKIHGRRIALQKTYFQAWGGSWVVVSEKRSALQDRKGGQKFKLSKVSMFEQCE